MSIFVIVFVMLVYVVVLLAMDTSATVTFMLPWRRTGYEVGTWLFFSITVIATAFITWILHILGVWHLKRRVRERQDELLETRGRLQRAEESLAQHESKIHEFTLQVLQLARAPLPDRAPSPSRVTVEETPERSALGPGVSASPTADSEGTSAPQ